MPPSQNDWQQVLRALTVVSRITISACPEVIIIKHYITCWNRQPADLRPLTMGKNTEKVQFSEVTFLQNNYTSDSNIKPKIEKS